MFKVPEGAAMDQKVNEAEKNYVIQKNDYLKLRVFTNNGELIIDPEYRLLKEMPTQASINKPDPNYLININGIAKFPMIGEIKLEGLTIRQAEAILQKEYSQYYKDAFATLEFTNKRVVVLGTTGGNVIPLVNENTRLVEVLALAKGIDNNAKVHNIRVIRGDQLMLVDLSTFESYKKNNIIVQPDDIIYIEPIRRPVSEALRDYGPILSVVTSLTTLIVVLFGIN